MSIETDFRALLAGNAGLSALVSTRIAQSAIPEGSAFPVVVFECAHGYIDGVNEPRLADRASITVQCWADTPVSAAQVADAVLAAIDTAPATHGARAVDRSTAYDAELGVDGVVLTVDWWA